MTNSEAIEVLKANYPDPCFELLREAVDTAIYALSAQPEPIKLHVDHALTEEEINNLKQKIADSPIVLMPYEKPEPAIPLSWIESYIEWLDSLDNGFSTLEALQINVMVRKWKDEQDD